MGVAPTKTPPNNIPEVLTNLQLTIETLKYENQTLKRDLLKEKREVKKLQRLLSTLDSSQQSVKPPTNLMTISKESNDTPDTIEGLRERIKLMEDTLQYQTADMELIKQNLPEVSYSFNHHDALGRQKYKQI